MKAFVATTLISLASTAALASQSLDFRIQDNIDRNVLVREDISSVTFEECAQAVCQLARTQGNGFCSPIPEIKVIGANLTSAGLDIVNNLSQLSEVHINSN